MRISGGESMVGTNEGRMAVASAFGYADARTMVFFRETYGFPLSLAAIQVKNAGLNIDYGGLRIELEKMGKKPDTIDSELKEVRFFFDTAMARKRESCI
jgi:hypothetical protein